MCSIIGYSDYRLAASLLIASLRRLEYRRYDSSGVNFVNSTKIKLGKASESLTNLECILDDNSCILAASGIAPHTGLPMICL